METLLTAVYSVCVCESSLYHAHVEPGLRMGTSSLTRPADTILFSFRSLSSAFCSARVFPSFSSTCKRE